MQHLRSLNDVFLQDVWLTIGSFDGVHIGHQDTVRRLAAGARENGVPAVVLTFYPHPREILREQTSFYLTSPDHRAELLGELGVDYVITHLFERKVAATSARDFMSELQTHLNIQVLWVGHDFALGRDRQGDIPTLRSLGVQLGYDVQETQAIRIDGEIVSSSRIRDLLSVGKVDQAKVLLGRPYQLEGNVVKGDQRGHTIGIPTANLKIWSGRALPASGVYVCKANINGDTWGAVTNIGVRPTFDNQTVLPIVETHLLNFGGNLYGQDIHLEFISRLRSEQRFETVESLVSQIQKDIQRSLEILST